MDVKLVDVLLRNKHPEDYQAALDYFVTTSSRRFTFDRLQRVWELSGSRLSETVTFNAAYEHGLLEHWYDTYIKGTEYEGI